MSAMGGSLPPQVLSAKRRIKSALTREKFGLVDAASVTTGRDYLHKLWQVSVSCPIGIALVHEGILPETLSNIFYELGLMHAYGRETVLIKVGHVTLPSDFVRTEYIPMDTRFSRAFSEYFKSLASRAKYYEQLAEELGGALAVDYLRRSYLLSGKIAAKRRARQLSENAAEFGPEDQYGTRSWPYSDLV